MYLDPSNASDIPKARLKWICEFDDYWPFPKPVLFKENGITFENLHQNQWSVAVREITEDAYSEILKRSGLSDASTTPELEVSQIQTPSISAKPLFVPRKLKESAISDRIRRSSVRRSKFAVEIGNHGEGIVLNGIDKLTS